MFYCYVINCFCGLKYFLYIMDNVGLCMYIFYRMDMFFFCIFGKVGVESEDRGIVLRRREYELEK